MTDSLNGTLRVVAELSAEVLASGARIPDRLIAFIIGEVLKGLWLTTTSLRWGASSSRPLQGAGASTTPSCSLRAGTRVSSTSEDFPEPETPVTTVSVPRGKETSTPRRLLARAPLRRIQP